MEVIADTRAWAQLNFGSAPLGDRKRIRRLVHSAATIAAHPEKPFTQVFDWNELRGFYRLCDQAETTLAAVQQPHWARTRLAMAAAALVLTLHDTTELDFTSHKALRGAGPIGDNHGTGFLQHSSLAILPQPRQVLGLAYQQWKVRQPAPAGESAAQRKRRERESALWKNGIKASGQAPEGCTWVDVADRGGDDYEALRAARQVGRDFLFRVCQNRLVWLSAAHDQQGYLLDYARTLAPQGSDQVDIPGRGGRPPRSATVALAGATVWIPAPAGTPQRAAQPILEAWVLRIWEPDPPAGVAEPLE